MADWINPDGKVKLLHGDCMIRMQELSTNSIDAIVTDPPYGLGFMNREWDDISKIKLFHHKWAIEALRVLKPGGHLLSCGGTRTYHRMTCAIEDVGFEIRDAVLWCYASGFPKSQNIAKAIDKKLGVKSEVISTQTLPDHRGDNYKQGHREYEYIEHEVTKATSEQAKEWEGWGTALKPAVEPICLARKPIAEKTIAANVMVYDTGGLNIEASRIYGSEDDANGRYPSNLLLDEEAAQILDEGSEVTKSSRANLTSKPGKIYGNGEGLPSYTGLYGFNDSGGPSRFFYVAKASSSERKESEHPTIKPVTLMKYLVRLITPPNGTVLDPFAGSGTTLEAAYQLGFNAIGIELDIENLETMIKRMQQGVLL